MTTQSCSWKEKWRRGGGGRGGGGGGGAGEEGWMKRQRRGEEEKKKWPCSSIIWGWIKLARAANLYLGAINRIKGEQQRRRGWLFSFFPLPAAAICNLCWMSSSGKVSESSSVSSSLGVGSLDRWIWQNKNTLLDSWEAVVRAAALSWSEEALHSGGLGARGRSDVTHDTGIFISLFIAYDLQGPIVLIRNHV